MRIRKPSPAMVVAVIALVMASAGTSIAAIDYARNAGAVDGFSAVSAGSSTREARGRLVATARGGANPGRIPATFLADVVRGDPFGRYAEVPDNATGDAAEISSTGFGRLTASCSDQNATAGREDPTTRLVFANGSGSTLNLSRRVAGGAGEVSSVAPGTVEELTINGSSSFTIHLEAGGINVLIDGAVRQDGRGTPAAACLVFGTARIIR